MAFTSFPPRQPFASTRLPLTLMTLDDWALATITGVDSEKYIQGQVTADVSQMTEHQHLLAAHCDAKGKMWSNLRLFRQGDGFAWLERRSLRDAQLTELKKYAVFSKVAIAPDDERVLLGVAGFQARAALANLFSELPNSDKQVITEGASTVLWFEHPAERFLLIVDATTAETLVEKLRGEAELNNSQQWLALDIEAGIPVIDTANSAQFIPQATNLQAGANKRAMWTLAGAAGRVPEAGEDLELKMGENWRRTGTVLAAVKLADGQVLVQVVMNNDMEADSVFRVRDDAKTLQIVPLPYSLEE
ncbi:MAG: tRNA-modifying protein YgfZ [Citrobacter freundii]|nr:tRNA-modifying protein YgfZ [Citrobacter freundii]